MRVRGILAALVSISWCMHSLGASIYKPADERVIVFAPHPDDDIIGCGGALVEHLKNGAHITIVYMTSGNAASCDCSPQELAKIRENEAKKGAKVLGVTNLIFLREPDGELEFSEETIERVADLIGKIRPEVIYVPHGGDGHKDHKTTFLIVSEAIKQAMDAEKAWRVPLTLCYEVWTPLSKISYKVDISDSIEKKCQALTQHASQISSRNYVDAFKSLARYRAVMMRCGQYCECFQKLTI